MNLLIDRAILTKPAAQAAGVQAFDLLDWSVTTVQHETSVETTGGLYRLTGHGWDGRAVLDWSLILKIITMPEQGCVDPTELCYWQREQQAYQSGLLADLTPTFRAPRCFAVDERPGSIWLWLEDIQESSDPTWDLPDYQIAARRLGEWSGAYLTDTPLPEYPWLCKSIFHSLLADGEWWAHFMDPASKNNAWQRPLVQQTFAEPLRSRILQLWKEKERFLTANVRLPRVFCHNDAHRRNLMLRAGPDQQPELVAIDWAFCGPGGLGNDLGELVGTSLSYFAVDPTQAVDLEGFVLDGYQAGLRDAGWPGDLRLARLGYFISLALWWGATLPCEAAMLADGRFRPEAKYGRPLEAVLPGWAKLSDFALDRADEARYWIGQLFG